MIFRYVSQKFGISCFKRPPASKVEKMKEHQKFFGALGGSKTGPYRAGTYMMNIYIYIISLGFEDHFNKGLSHETY